MAKKFKNWKNQRLWWPPSAQNDQKMIGNGQKCSKMGYNGQLWTKKA